MQRVSFIQHGGARILFLDFSALLPEELEKVVEEAREVIHASPPKSLLTLTMVDGGRFNARTVDVLKQFAKGNEPFVVAGAIVGLSGLQRLVLDAVSKFTGRNFLVCKTVEEAKERLVTQG